MTGPWRDRTVTGHIPLSLDGRVTGPGGEHDRGWTARHAACGEARAQLLAVTGPASTALLGRRTYQGFAAAWPTRILPTRRTLTITSAGTSRGTANCSWASTSKAAG